MKRVHPDAMVTLTFMMETHFPDGSVKERPQETFRFIFGVETQVPALEKAIEGSAVGERIYITIPDSDLYGRHDPGLIREIPQKGLIKQRLKEGQYYRQIKKGGLISFKVLELRSDTVLADFNRPMAGLWVTMDAEISDIREASQEEIHGAREAQIKKDIGCG